MPHWHYILFLQANTSFMAACDPMSFSGITPQVFSSISKQLADKGFALNGPRGTVNGPFGIVIQYEWIETSGQLTIQVVEKNFFVTCSQIREQLTSALSKYVS
jgi:hypothetical protein